MKCIAIIGVGSLGGFFAEYLSKIPKLKTLVLIDHDKVEEKNIKNSIYRKRDVGQFKVDALENIIKSVTDIDIIKTTQKYNEKTVTLPECDLVFDCRDTIENRFNTISARLYISFRNLVVDCRKNISVKQEKKGKYTEYLTKSDTMNAAFQAFYLVSTGIIFDLVQKQVIHEVSLDLQNKNASDSIQVVNDRPDMISDNIYTEKIPNVYEHIPMIIDKRKEKDIPVYIGIKELSCQKFTLPRLAPPTHNDIVPVNSNKLIQQTAQELATIVDNLVLKYPSYVIRVANQNGGIYVELIPETGGA